MHYTTHIPKTTYTERHKRFLAVRAEARRSLAQCQAVHSVLVQASRAKLSRNYIDAPLLEQAGKQIVKISKVMRGLSPVAGQPDPPRYEPVSAVQSVHETRTYGGVKASRLVRVLRFLRGLRRAQGDVALARRVRTLSNRLINGMDIYTRVKALVAKLTDAIEAPETAMIPRRISRPAEAPLVPTPAFKWEVSPQKIYGWNRHLSVKGYDPRQTSVYWLERQASGLRRAVYRAHHGIEATASSPAKRPQIQHADTRAYTVPEGAQITGEIWPPIDLVRMIEDHRNAERGAKRNTESEGQSEDIHDGVSECRADCFETHRASAPLHIQVNSHARPETPLPDE